MPLNKQNSIKFYKMHGLGNDFVIIYCDTDINPELYPKLVDQNSSHHPISPETIATISNRNLGIGCDQLMIVHPILPQKNLPNTLTHSSKNKDSSLHSNNNQTIVTIYNADGTRASACGNGMRSVAFLLHNLSLKLSNNNRNSIAQSKQQFQLLVTQPTADFTYKTITTTIEKVLNQTTAVVSVNMGKYQTQPNYIKPDKKYLGNCYVDIGNPHLIIIVDDIRNADMEFAATLSRNPTLFPEHANISFVTLRNHDTIIAHDQQTTIFSNMPFPNSQTIQIRTFERGAGPTLACGSAACAALIALNTLGLIETNAYVISEGGKLYSKIINEEAFLYGDANLVYSGQLYLN